MISIITINFNNKAGLQETIESVVSQSNKLFEYIVIDGGSTDGSVEVIKEHAGNITYWVSEKDRGVYNAMNKGIEKATGDYLIFLNSGDCLIHPQVLQNSCDFIKQFPGADVYFGDIVIVNDKSHPADIDWKHPEQIDLPFLKIETINHQAALIRASLFKELGSYPELYKIAADYWLWLQALLNNKSFKHVGFPMVYYDSNGISSANRALYRQEKQQIWDSLVPQCVQQLLDENERLKQVVAYKLVKAAIRINEQYQLFKSR